MSSSAVPGRAQHTWRAHKPPSARGRHGKLDPKRRLKAKAVRETRACLRCSVLRISCSQDEICGPCRKLVETSRHPYERRTLSFCGCIRTQVLEVNPFAAAIPPPHKLNALLKGADRLKLRCIRLSFDSQITWDLSTIIHELVEWLDNPACLTTSKVGLLSSPRFIDLMEPYIGPEIGANFQRMLYAESLVYTRKRSYEKHILSNKDLQQIGAVGGYAILSVLDRKLKPEALRACFREKAQLEALFLVLIGTILAVGYATPYINCDGAMAEVPETSKKPYAQFTAMQDHLCQILAHYVLLLASRLDLPIRNTAEGFILQAASKRWHKNGMFVWIACEEDGATVPWDRFYYTKPQGFESRHLGTTVLSEPCHPPISNNSDELSGDNLPLISLPASLEPGYDMQEKLLSDYPVEYSQRNMNNIFSSTLSTHIPATKEATNSNTIPFNTEWDLENPYPSETHSRNPVGHDLEPSHGPMSVNPKLEGLSSRRPCRHSRQLKQVCTVTPFWALELSSHFSRKMMTSNDSFNASESNVILNPPTPKLDIIQNPRIWKRYLELSLEGCQDMSYKEVILGQIKAEQHQQHLLV